jgi:hypothetical protein
VEIAGTLCAPVPVVMWAHGGVIVVAARTLGRLGREGSAITGVVKAQPEIAPLRMEDELAFLRALHLLSGLDSHIEPRVGFRRYGK